jgi:phospholipase/carboxylesterase
VHKVARILHKNAAAVNGESLGYPAATLLETIDVETAPRPTASIIWMHGLGADAHDFEPVVPAIVRSGEKPWRFVFPNAPQRPVTLNGGMRMRAWYDIKSLDRGMIEDDAGFRDSDARIRELIAREGGRGVPPSRIVLAGFSQGGALSLYTAPRFPEALAGVVALSAYLPLRGSFAAARSPANQATRIFMAHGSSDMVISPAIGRESREFLEAQGYAVEWHEYPMAHSVCSDEVADIGAFLRRVLP